jgi:hypothetical protein
VNPEYGCGIPTRLVDSTLLSVVVKSVRINKKKPAAILAAGFRESTHPCTMGVSLVVLLWLVKPEIMCQQYDCSEHDYGG